MLGRKRIIFFVIALLLVSSLFAGCKEGMEEEGKEIVDKIADELIKEGKATPTPQPEPTPSPTPMKTGLRFSDEVEKKLDKLWFGSNTGLDAFDSDYAVFCDNGPDGNNFVTFRFHSTDTQQKIQEEYGRSLFGSTLDAMSYNGQFVGETNENGDPLQITFDIQPSADGFYVYVGAMPLSPTPLVDEVLDMYWPANGIVNEQITDDMLMYKGFGYDTQNGGSAMYKMWNIGCPDITAEIFAWYEEHYKDAPGYSKTEETPLVPRISFTYDILGDGGSKTQCEVWVDAFLEPGYIKLRMATDIDF